MDVASHRYAAAAIHQCSARKFDTVRGAHGFRICRFGLWLRVYRSKARIPDSGFAPCARPGGSFFFVLLRARIGTPGESVDRHEREGFGRSRRRTVCSILERRIRHEGARKQSGADQKRRISLGRRLVLASRRRPRDLLKVPESFSPIKNNRAMEGKMMQRWLMIFAAVILLMGTGPLSAQQSGGTKIGTLTCRTSGSLGLILGSHQKLHCSFSPDNGAPEHYVGHITRIGLDLGIRAGGVLIWGVLAPTSSLHHGALSGTYVGASGSASLGLGVGANVLIGGSHRSFTLQPLSVEGKAGVNLALGVAGLTLRSGR